MTTKGDRREKQIDIVVSEIFTIRDTLLKDKFGKLDPNSLTMAIGRLAILKMSLSENMVDLEEQMLQGKTAKEVFIATTYKEKRDTGTSQKDAELASRAEAETIQLEVINFEKQWKMIRALREDISDLIDVVRSRISFIKSERQETSLVGQYER